MALRDLSPLDRWTILYAVFACLVFLWRWPASAAVASHFPVVHAGLAGLALMAPRMRRHGLLGEAWADFYPLILTLALYTEIGLLNRAVGVSHDLTVQAWEAALFGGQPSRDWIRAWPSPWLSWPLHLGYLSYYVILAGSPLGLWWLGRRVGARESACLIMVAFYVCYAVFLLFPVAGPRYLFAQAENRATAIPIAIFTQTLLNRGGAWGTAFPSSHVAASLVASVTAWRFSRFLGALLVSLSVLLAVGTVYGQFHYLLDALAGAAVAAAVLAVAPRVSGTPQLHNV
jgi:membrane-associated phospholipid phosphatase